MSQAAIAAAPATSARAARLIEEHRQAVHRRTDRLFMVLMPLQWIAAIAAALWLSPLTWQGSASSTHPHVWAALFLGGAITIFPVGLAAALPGSVLTRHVIAAGQMLMSALLIHLTGGRIETHFHVFGSLAFLAFYRDWRVLVTASAVVATDHILRGVYWPQSVYGVLAAAPWRWLEHAGWVVFEDIFLTISIVQNTSAEERQAHLEIANEVIEAAVAQRTTELEASKAAAETANRTKSEFLASMSHELRTPLNAVIGFSELLTEQLFGPLNDRQREYTQSILTSGKHLLQLINDILDLAKIEAGRMELELSEVSVIEALQEVHGITGPLAAKKRIVLQIDAAPGCPTITADGAKVKQILFNLVSNALKFTPEGGRVTMAAAHVTDDSRAYGGLRISVTDTGIGIRPEDCERVFAEFVQVDSSLSRRHDGTGLGLALTRKLVDLHGGKIRVESEGEGRGSTFIVELPLGPDSRPAPEPAAPPPAAPPPAEPERDGYERLVLIIEDDRPTSDLLCEYLTAGGYAPIRAFDGEQGLRMARQLAPDAIVLDILIPEVDGWRVLADLRSHPATRRIPIVVVSVTEDRRVGLALGAAEWLVKPVDRCRLLDAVRKARPASGGPGTVLVVDDEPQTVGLISDLLRSEGYDVLQAGGGQEGLDLAIEKLPDGIILDLMMPDVTGFEVVRKLQEHPQARHIPVVIYTAKDVTSEDRSRLHRAAGAVLSKSSGDGLLKELEKVVARQN